MFEVVQQERKSAVLSPSELPCLGSIPTVNLTSGCAHGCLYCYARSYSGHPGEGRIVVYSNTVDKFRRELPRKRTKPALVYFSPSTDVFQPLEPVQDLAYDIFSSLFENGVGIAFVTKGEIPERHMRLLESNASMVRAQIGLITLDERLTASFEPHTPSPHVRLSQIRRLVRAGIETEVRFDPILPGLTDDDDTMHSLLSAVSDTGVRRVALNTLYLRPALVRTLRTKLVDSELQRVLLDQFSDGERLLVCNGRFSQTALRKNKRVRIYQRARDIARHYGISTTICGCMNPDICSENCNLSGTWPKTAGVGTQTDLVD